MPPLPSPGNEIRSALASLVTGSRLLNRHLSYGLPEFLVAGEPGLNSGFAGAQYPATALIATGEGSLKARNTKRDARVSLSVVAMDNPYREAQLRGRVVERRPDAKFEIMDRISRKYTGKEYSNPIGPQGRVILKVAPDKVNTPQRLGR